MSHSNPMYWVDWAGGEYYLYLPGRTSVASITRISAGFYSADVHAFGSMERKTGGNLLELRNFCEKKIAERLHTQWNDKAKITQPGEM